MDLSNENMVHVKKDGIEIVVNYDIDDEIKESKSMIGNLGGTVEDIKEVEIPFSDIKRKIILIRKEKDTPSQFPRKPNKIK